MTVEIDMDEAVQVLEMLRHHTAIAPKFRVHLDNEITCECEGASERAYEAFHGGDGAGQNQAAAVSAAMREAGR